MVNFFLTIALDFTIVARQRSALLLAVALALAIAAPAMGQASSRSKTGPVPNNGKLALDPPTGALPAAEVDLPAAVAAETSRLSFHVSPLSGKGLLLQQTRDALKALTRASRGGRIVKLRAFVAGSGDARRVRQIVSDAFAEKKQPLPALTTIQAASCRRTERRS